MIVKRPNDSARVRALSTMIVIVVTWLVYSFWIEPDLKRAERQIDQAADDLSRSSRETLRRLDAER